MPRSKTETFSVFGQIEEVAANIMISEHSARRIDFDDMPDLPGIRYNANGDRAKFAVVIEGRGAVRRFKKLIADLRA